MNRIAICDDVKKDRSELRSALLRYFRACGEPLPQIKEYGSGEGLLVDLEEGYDLFSLIFLDIHMDRLTGMETAYRLRQIGWNSLLVFFTVTPDFAVESYEVDAAGYLLKPLNREKLFRLLDKILSRQEPPRILLKLGRAYRYLYHEEIRYAESSNHVTLLHLINGETVSTREKLSQIEERLRDPSFLRCHQSFLVNMNQVADVREDFILKDGSSVPIRVRGRREITDAYLHYFVSHSLDAPPDREGPL